MKYFLSVFGIVAAFFMMYYREKVGDLIGSAEWMNKLGGVHNVIVISALLIFFWSIATITGTTSILFSPLLWLIPGVPETPTGDF